MNDFSFYSFFYNTEVGQIYMNRDTGTLYLVTMVHEEDYCDTECIWSRDPRLIGQIDHWWSIRKSVNTLIC
jgi:hypothetical protein